MENLRVQSLFDDNTVPLQSSFKTEVVKRLKKSKKTSSSRKSKDLSCVNCPYHGHQPILFETNPSAKVLVVLLAPGRKESELGVPLIGQRGSTVVRAFKEAGWNLDDIQFRYLLCCYPGTLDRQLPSKSACTLCFKMHLQSDFETYDKIIVFGKPATSFLLQEWDVTFLHNVVLSQSLRKRVGVTFSGLEIVQSSDNFKLAVEDLKFFRKVFLENYRLSAVYVDTNEKLESFKKWISTQDKIAIDIETTGVSFTDNILMLGFGNADEAYIVPLVGRYSQYREVVKSILSSEKFFIAHNAMFEYRFLVDQGLAPDTIKFRDTMFMEYLMFPGAQKGAYRLKVAAPLRGLRWSMLLNNPSLWFEDLQILAYYNGEDCINTFRLYQVLESEIQKRGHWFVFEEIMNKSINVVGDMHRYGVLIDRDRLIQMKQKFSAAKDLLTSELNERFGQRNWGSTMQLAQFFQEDLKLTSVKLTSTGRMSTDNEALKQLMEVYSDNEDVVFVVERLLRMRTVDKLYGTYVIGLEKKIDIDGRLRGNFLLTGTATGRLSSFSPNLQNIPRQSVIKQMFVAPKGYKLVEIDAAQAELRMVASIAPEPKMIEAYERGEDLHRLTASLILNKDVSEVSKTDRQLAKAVNFGLIYGQSWIGFKAYAKNSFGVTLTDEEAKLFRTKFFEAYPGIAEFHRRVKDKIYSGDIVVITPFGRKRYLLEGDKEHKVRQALNTPIQSAASDCNLLLMRYVWEHIDRRKAQFLLTVHDSMLLQVKEDYFFDFIKVVRDGVEYLNRTVTWLKCRFEVDGKYGYSWGEMQEFTLDEILK